MGVVEEKILEFLTKVRKIMFRHDVTIFNFLMRYNSVLDFFRKVFPVLMGRALPCFRKTQGICFASFAKLRFTFVTPLQAGVKSEVSPPLRIRFTTRIFRFLKFRDLVHPLPLCNQKLVHVTYFAAWAGR